MTSPATTTTPPKERPILFSAPMVRALLDGTKTQTRRIVKIQSTTTEPPYLRPDGRYTYTVCEGHAVGEPFPCPYGIPGDRLWVRENYRYSLPDSIRYQADGAVIITKPPASVVIPNHKLNDWRPSIHMPRWASRLTLEITEIRVQRLQDISEEDAIAEGIECAHRDEDRTFWKNYRFKSPHPKRGKVWNPEENQIVNYNREPIRSYQSLWESINGPGSWDANPYVWAITFRRLVPEN